MKLKLIDVASASFNIIENASIFNIASYSICSLYMGKLGKYESKEIVKARFNMYQNILDKSELPKPYPEDIKDIEQARKRLEAGTYLYHNFIEDLIDVARIYRRFDFETWFAANKFDKKRMIIEEIYGGMLHLAEHLGWEKEPLHKAFEACKSANYENAWTVEKLGNKTSTNRKLKAAIYVEYDIDEFRTFVIFSDNSGVQLQKTQIHTINFFAENADIPDDIFDILKGKTKWEKHDFVLLNKNNVEIARVKF